MGVLQKYIEDINWLLKLPMSDIRKDAEKACLLSYLTQFEYGSVLQFVYFRTIYWRKAVEIVTREQLAHGIVGVVHGINMSERTINRALLFLEDKGYLLAVRISSRGRVIGVGYILNIYAILDDSSFLLTKIAHGAEQAVARLKKAYRVISNLQLIAIDVNGDWEMDLEDAMEKARQRTESGKTRAQARRAKKPQRDSIFRRVDELVEALGAPRVVWTGKLRGMAKNYVAQDHVGDIDTAYRQIELAFTNWDAARRKIASNTRDRVRVSKSPSLQDFYTFRRLFSDLEIDKWETGSVLVMNARTASTSEKPILRVGATKRTPD